MGRRSWIQPVGLLLLAAICFFAAQGTGIRLFFHLFYLLCALVLLSYLWAWTNLRGLRVEREALATRAQVGDMARERLLLRNLWPIPKIWVEVRDSSDMPLHGGGLVTYLPGGGQRRWMTKTPCTMRGKFTLGPSTLVSSDPFGIFQLERRVPGVNELIVYPQTVPLPGFILPSAELPGGQDVRSRAYHVTPNVSTIRDYQPGDSFNRIHWRSTARAGKLVAKEFELDPTADVYVILDMHERVQQSLVTPLSRTGDPLITRTAESTEEYGVQAAASITQQLLNMNRTVGLVAWGQHREVIPAERESRQLFKMLEALAILRAYGSQPLAEVLAAESSRFGRNCTLVIITPSLDERWIVSLQQLLYRGARAVVVHVEPHSFGGWVESSTIYRRLAELRVSVYRFACGDSLADVLQQPMVSDELRQRM